MSDLSIMEQKVFGVNASRHPITNMVLENGSGALSPDMQARLIHLPEIARTQGKDAAQAMLAKLDAAKAAAAPAPLQIIPGNEQAQS